MKFWKYAEVIWIVIAFLLLLGVARVAQADYIYDLQANLTQGEAVYVDQQPFYYDMFYIYSDNPATLTFENYDANLSSSNPHYDFNDPYLYIYTVETPAFNGFSGASVQLVLFDEDDDGNEDSPEGLYFFLDDVDINGELVALISSYDPYVTGTVDFTITSDQPLSIIPEPATISFIALGAVSLLFVRRLVS